MTVAPPERGYSGAAVIGTALLGFLLVVILGYVGLFWLLP